MWSGASRSINYGLPPEMSMVGLRDVFVVAPASSFHHNNHHQHHHDPVMADPHSVNGSNPATALGVGVGVGVIPLLTTARCLGPANIGVDNENMMSNRNRGGGIQLWHDQQYLKKPGLLEDSTSSGNLLHSGGGGGLTGSATAGGATCQDCGNQAKKDCTHRRCRTCCRSRGFDCPTHVKSTWVPATRRRERQLMAEAAAGAGGSSGSSSGVKKPRLVSSQTTTSHTSTSNTTPPRSFDTGSSHQDASFIESLPAQVRAPAVFKCVRVSAMEDGQEEYAYHAVVTIGGHVFKGFLHDQGVESSRDGYPNLSELHLGGGGGNDGSGSGGGGSGRNGASSSSPMLDPSDLYAASGGGLLGSSAYGNPIN